MDRLVAVDGKEVDSWSHDQVVTLIRQSGQSCSLLVVDKFTDQMYKLVRDNAARCPELGKQAVYNDAVLSLTGKRVPSALPQLFE